MAFNAKDSAEDNMRTNDVVYKNGQAYDPVFDNALNRQSDYGDDYENGRNRTVFGKLAERINDNRDKKKNAQDALKKGEDGASKDPNKNGRGGDKDASLGQKEENVEADTAQGKFKNAVQGIQDLKSGKISKGSSKLKKAVPAVVILAILFGFGGMSFMSGASLPESFMSQLEGRFDFSGVTIKQRSQNGLKFQTNNGLLKDCRKAPKLFAQFGIGSNKTTFKPSKKMIKKLKAQGIEFEDVDGIKVMKYKGRTIVADENDAVGGRLYFEDVFQNDPEFQAAYTKGARTWRGSVADWFDSRIEGFLERIGVDRNLWKDFQSARARAQSGDTGSGTDMTTIRKTISEYADSDTAEGKVKGTNSKEGKETTDEKTGDTVKSDPEIDEKNPEMTDATFKRADVEVDSDGKITNTDKVKSRLESVGGGVQSLKKISSAANLVVNISCGAQDFISAVSAIITAYQAVQIIKTSSAIFEAFQKAKTGEADASPYNELARSMMEPTMASYTQVLSVNNDGDALETQTVSRERSAVQAESSYALYRGEAIDGSDLSVQSFNINTVANNAFREVQRLVGASEKKVSVTAASFAACTSARIAAAAVGAATDVASIIGCTVAGLGSFGAALLGCIVGAAAEMSGLQVIASMVLSTLVSFMVPWVAHVLTRTIATEVMGEDLGNALVSGGNKLYGGQYQSAGGSVATKDTLPQFFQLQAFEKEEIARYERATRSPFDISSQYTFLGSLATKMIPLTSSMHSTSSFIKGLGDLFTGSLSSLLPRSSAISAGIRAEEELEYTKKYCPDVYYIGGIADATCDPYFISDLSTIDTHPADIIDSIDDEDLKADDDGNPVIQEKSNLARYIVYCGQRSSPWGKADQNIMAQVTPSLDDGARTNISVGEATVSPLSGIAGAVPVVGDALDIAEGVGKLENMGWITGSACVTGREKEADELNVPTLKKRQEYQRFMEDQALAEAEGLGESAVSKFLVEYYKKNPLDNSFEGVLARYSGLTKENVIATLDTLDALTYIANYDPSDYYPYIVEEEEHIISFADNNHYDQYYADVVLSQGYSIDVKKEAYIS